MTSAPEWTSSSRLQDEEDLVLQVNGERWKVRCRPDAPLLYVLRNDLDLKGSRYGCGLGQCGACMVLLDGDPTPACDLPVWSVQGHEVVTIEGLGNDGGMQALQRAFTVEQAAQCGYCMSGILVSSCALLRTEPSPDRAAIEEALEKNLCRCGSQGRVVRAVLAAADAVESRVALPAPRERRLAMEVLNGESQVAEPASSVISLSANPLLSQWVEFVPGGRVLLRVGKVEIGQGIVTALTQIAAEELDVDWLQVEAVPVSTAGSPDEGVTAGSRSVMDSGSAVREVCAEVRRLLLSAVSAETGVPVGELDVRGGKIRDRAGVVRGDYWSVARPGLLDVPVSGMAQPKEPGRHEVVGRSLPRRDLAAKFLGRPAFVHDLTFPGQLFGRVVRPPSPGAGLVDVDQTAARAVPAVVTVVRLGSFLGVVAEREEEAVRAAELLRRAAIWSTPDPLPDQATWTSELASHAAEEAQFERRTDPAAAARVVDRFSASYSRGYVAHASIGPGCALARWDDEEGVSVWSHTQGVFPLRHAVAASLGLDLDQVTVHHMEGAGCYGHNSADDVAFDAVLLARAVPGRHVHVVWSRDDEFAWEPYGSAMVVQVAVGVDASGDLVSWKQDSWSNGHHGRPGYAGQPGLLAAWHAADAEAVAASDPSPAAGGGIGRNAVPGYALADLDVRTHRLLTMPLRTSSLRGLGATANVFAIESAMDELAARSGVDPLEYRLRHLPDQRGRRVLEVVADKAAWAARPEEESVGWGLAYARYKGVCGYCAVVARVEALSDLRVSDLWVAVDAGQIINPDGLANQIEGGAIQATSWALREQVTYDRRTVTSRDWDGYPILRFGEIPNVHVTLVSRPDEPPIGAGEVTGGPVAAAVANALADAIGVRVRDLPLTTDRILSVIST